MKHRDKTFSDVLQQLQLMMSYYKRGKNMGNMGYSMGYLISIITISASAYLAYSNEAEGLEQIP